MAGFVAIRRGTGRLPAPPGPLAPGALRCRRKFLGYFPGGFRDQGYLDLERAYKQAAHERWRETLNPVAYRLLLRRGQYDRIAHEALLIEGRTNLLYSYEKMAIRDALETREGARIFARGLYDFLHGRAGDEKRFLAWRDAVADLPRRKTRVLTWPVLTVFPYLARPDAHLFLKPKVTRVAAERYGYPFRYGSGPDWDIYAGLLDFARILHRDLRDLGPRDMLDIQGFIWVLGSEEYPE